MKKIIEIRYCKYCGDLIPETRKMGALYCINNCGWTFRNRKNAQEKKEMQKIEHGLYKSYNILKELFGRGYKNISIETLKVLGFDFNCYTSILGIDSLNNNTEFKLFEFSYTIDGDRIKIKKLKDGRI